MITPQECFVQLQALTEKLSASASDIAAKKSFGAAVKDFREAAGMTRSQFARRLGVVVQTVHRWEEIGIGFRTAAEKILCLLDDRILHNPQKDDSHESASKNGDSRAKVTVTFEIETEVVANLLRELLQAKQKA